MTVPLSEICIELDRLIDSWEPRLESLSEQTVSVTRNNQNRTIKEIVGHMVDSATNNTHRIIHLQYQESPVNYPDYANLGNNDRWIAIQNFQVEQWQLLVRLWVSVNRHIVHVIGQADNAKMGQVWVSATGEEISLGAMIEDYPLHFRLHLNEIEELIKAS